MRYARILVWTFALAIELQAQASPAMTPGALTAADSVVRRYLALVVERDDFAPAQFVGLRSEAEVCEQELYGDSFSSYWLAAGRPLSFVWRADTLRAVLELLTVAALEPSSTHPYGSVVSARVRTDTLEQKLLFDPSRSRWQLCGTLSNGYLLGSHGRPDLWEYRPVGTTRASLLRTIDSLRSALIDRRPNEELKPTAVASAAAGSLRSPAAFLMARRGLTPAR